MIWPFRNRSKDAETIRQLRDENERAWEYYTNQVLLTNAAESAMRAMQKAATEEGLDDIAKAATAQIADIYAGHSGGVKSRDTRVYAVIHATVREAMLGKKCWNTDILAAEAYREEAG